MHSVKKALATGCIMAVVYDHDVRAVSKNFRLRQCIYSVKKFQSPELLSMEKEHIWTNSVKKAQEHYSVSTVLTGLMVVG